MKPSPSAGRSTEARKLVAFAFLFSFLAAAGVAYRSHKDHRNFFPVALHAIPEFELFAAAAPELSSDRTEIQDKQKQLFARLIGPGVAFINPPRPLDKPADIVVQRQPFMTAASLPAAAPPVSPRRGIVISEIEAEPHPVKHDEPPWVIESRLPPRPKPRSQISLAQTLALTSLSGAVGSIELAAAAGSGATEVLDARPGVLLVGASSGFNESSSDVFNGAVVLLLKVCGCHPSIFGLILNHRSEKRMADAFCPLASARYPSFVNNSIMLGGPVGPMWSLLHEAHLDGSHQVLPGLFVGGSLFELQKRVTYGAAHASDAAFVSGYSAWHIARLQEEVDAGKWRAFQLDDATRLHPLIFEAKAAKAAPAASA